jgi:uncharacterized protein
MASDQIRYDLLTQDALRGVIRRVLADVARDGVPGEHHFYVTFKTGARGVRVSQRLRQTYPDEMTIVLQHQFWDLVVTEQTFEVGLAFGGIPERLLVPFDAITGFFDPSVQFGVKFEVETEGEAEAEAGQPRRQPPGAGSEPEEKAPSMLRPEKPGKAEPKPADADGAAEAPDTGGAAIVRLDTFRKKT